MRGRMLGAALLVAVGLVWMAQGLGLFPGSGLMDGQLLWVIIGGGLVVAGIALGLSARRRPPDPGA